MNCVDRAGNLFEYNSETVRTPLDVICMWLFRESIHFHSFIFFLLTRTQHTPHTEMQIFLPGPSSVRGRIKIPHYLCNSIRHVGLSRSEKCVLTVTSADRYNLYEDEGRRIADAKYDMQITFIHSLSSTVSSKPFFYMHSQRQMFVWLIICWKSLFLC